MSKGLVEISLAKWADDGFPGPAPGDLVNSSNPTSWLAGGIKWFEALKTGRVATWSHTMRYRGQGRLYSQEGVQRLDKPFAELVGQKVRIYHNPAYNDDQRQLLGTEEELREGMLYDGLGIAGQMLAPLPLIGTGLAHLIQAPNLNYCSEGRAQIEQKINPQFCAGHDQVSPQAIDDWCLAAGWLTYTFRLVA